MKIIHILHLKKDKLFFLLVFLLCSIGLHAQTTIRYQETIQGGATIIGNSWFYSLPGAINTRLVPDIDGIASTGRSSSADLILPAGSKIEKAFLAIETGYSATSNLSSVKLRTPGGSNYTTLLATSSIANKFATQGYAQMIWDITSMIPANGYVSTAAGGTGGRFYLADPTPSPVIMGGWSIIVVYSNPNSKFRNITVADNWQYFSNSTVSTDITGINVPGSGSVKAVVGVTGTYGDRGYSDLLNFGKQGTTLTALKDPMTGVTNDALNSSIAWTATNNVSADGGPAISGNYTARNPISAGHIYGAAESWDFDADIFDASGILSPSSSPINITLQQQSTGGDVLVSGSYFISVDLAIAPKLSKTLSPTTINDGGIATYTWSVTNTLSDAINQTISFQDNLPSSIKVASTPNASIVGGTGGTITAVSGSNSVTISNLLLAPGQSATIKVDVTNVPGQINATCTGNPSAFTNSASNISLGSGVSLDATGIIPQCLIVEQTYCYKPAITTGTALDTKHGISALGRAGSDNGNWPMVRKGAWTAMESKTKGFVVNRIPTTAQVNALPNPVEGMMVYDEQADCLKIYTTTNGTAFSWQCFNTQACPDN